LWSVALALTTKQRAISAPQTFSSSSSSGILPWSQYGTYADTADKIDYPWSGIVSFTADDVAFIGNLPFSGRSHQFILGAYHATGMATTF
jgi:hypothetical protein